MKRILAIFFLLFAWQASAMTLEEANRRFDAGDFSGAVLGYQELLKEKGPDAAIYYNLGNSHQRLKQYGPAILAYERARLLKPRDPDLTANLALARKAATAFEEPGMNPRLAAVLSYLSRDEWSWLVGGSALLLGVLAVVRGAVVWPRRMNIPAVVVSSFAGLAIVAGSVALWLRRDEVTRGIVLTEKASVLLSPFEKAEVIGTAAAGRTVRLGESKGGFRYVEVPASTLRGWLSEKDVEPVQPEAGK
ncbi:MAG: hypothetical protein EOP88_22385 [Verrucomicrobiaceae bacterium]|nr:MAG: hypothetical protein EOP88_22385 [Verrucomicrobiaceae bacterium]